MGFSRKILDSLLPRGSAWRVRYDGGMDHLFDGVSDGFEIMRAACASIAKIREPRETTQIEDLEREFGVVSTEAASDAVRRQYLHGVVYGDLGTGSSDNLEDRLDAAGFSVHVYQNDPAINPADLLASGAGIGCGEVEAFCGGEDAYCGGTVGYLLVNGEMIMNPIEYLTNLPRRYWPLVFIVAGSCYGGDALEDWDMERPDLSFWTLLGGDISKTTAYSSPNGIRALKVRPIASEIDVDDQKLWAPNPDPDLCDWVRVYDSGSGVVANQAWANKLIDGNCEAVGVTAWTGDGVGVRAKSTSAYAGVRSLSVTATGDGTGTASQGALVNAELYTLTGWAHGDGTAAPKIWENGNVIWTGTSGTDWQSIDVDFEATGMTLTFGADAAGTVLFDDLLLTCVTGGSAELSGAMAIVAASDDPIGPFSESSVFPGRVFDSSPSRALAAQNMTIGIWVEVDAFAEEATIIGNGVARTDPTTLQLWHDADGLATFTRGDGTSLFSVEAQLVAGKLHRIVLTQSYDGTEATIAIYVDGALVDSTGFGPGTGAPDTTYKGLYVGDMFSSTPPSFAGRASVVDTYEATKSAEWVLADWKSGMEVMANGAGVEQEFSTGALASAKDFTASAWEVNGRPGAILGLDETGVWNVLWFGDANVGTRQAISTEAFAGMSAVRLLAKHSAGIGSDGNPAFVVFDDIFVNDVAYTQAEVLAPMRSKFERLILASKPVHSWALLLINYIPETSEGGGSTPVFYEQTEDDEMAIKQITMTQLGTAVIANADVDVHVYLSADAAVTSSIVQFDDATTFGSGPRLHRLTNRSENCIVTVRNYTGSITAILPPGGIMQCSLEDTSTAGGDWQFDTHVLGDVSEV